MNTAFLVSPFPMGRHPGTRPQCWDNYSSKGMCCESCYLMRGITTLCRYKSCIQAYCLDQLGILCTHLRCAFVMVSDNRRYYCVLHPSTIYHNILHPLTMFSQCCILHIKGGRQNSKLIQPVVYYIRQQSIIIFSHLRTMFSQCCILHIKGGRWNSKLIQPVVPGYSWYHHTLDNDANAVIV